MMYMHCRKCLSEIPKGVSPREWAHLEVSATQGDKPMITVHCVRHEMLVAQLPLAPLPARLQCACEGCAS